MIQNDSVSLDEVIKFTNNGVVYANFAQLKNALINDYKSIYGSDIDLSTGTADGVWIHHLGLLLNNLIQSEKNLYSNLNVDTASGVYLDNLCALSNIKRKPATKSYTYLKVTNQLLSSQSFPNGIICVSDDNVEWSYNGAVDFDPDETKALLFTCNESGPIQALAGTINKTIVESNLSIVQENDAIIGSPAESDEQLRARRAQSNGAQGNSIIESLIGALREIVGIDDVKVYNNTASATAKDGTSMLAHSVYLLLRYDPSITIADETIGEIIFNKLTPGIPTVVGNMSYEKALINIGDTDETETINWKKCTPVHPAVTVTISPILTNNFSADEMELVGQELIEYLNSIPIGQDVSEQDFTIEAIFADPQFKGRPTYTVSSVSLPAALTTNADTYFNYTTASFSNNILTIQ